MIIDLDLHPRQFDVFSDDARIRMLVSGRRFGKTRVQIVSVVERVLNWQGTVNPLNPETVLVAMPTRVMARRVIWKPLMSIFEKLGASINRTDGKIELPGKPPILVAGLENGDALRGLRLFSVHLDEAQDMDFQLIQSVVMPAMADTPNSKMFITGTPKGKVNWFYKFSQRDDVSFHNYPTAANPYVSREEIKRAKNQLSSKLFSQEFEASFTDFDHQIYTEFDLSKNTYDTVCPLDRVFMGLDFGDVNPAFVVVGVTTDKVFYVLEAKKVGDGKQPVPADVFYREVAKSCSHWGVYKIFCDPSRPAAILDMRKYGESKGIQGMVRAIKGDNSIETGLNLVNNLFYQGRLKVPSRDPICDNIQSYHWDSKGKVEGNQDDHTLDALRYCLFTLNNRVRGLINVPI